MTSSTDKALAGWRVLVPRGGKWGDGVAASLRRLGAQPVIAPMINFAFTEEVEALTSALERLRDGHFDWVTVTSATTVDVLAAQQAVIPESTRVAAVGETTAAALAAAGFRVDFVPSGDNSAAGMLREWAGTGRERILTLRSAIAKPVLTDGLRELGNDVESVVAYRTVGVPVPRNVVLDVADGRIDAILVTSGSVAAQVKAQFEHIPEGTLVAAIGPTTAADARAIGLRVDVLAGQPSASALLQALVDERTPEH